MSLTEDDNNSPPVILAMINSSVRVSTHEAQFLQDAMELLIPCVQCLFEAIDSLF